MSEDVIKLFDDVSRVLKGIDERLRKTEQEIKELKNYIEEKGVSK